jgi:hypothetical protein
VGGHRPPPLLVIQWGRGLPAQEAGRVLAARRIKEGYSPYRHGMRTRIPCLLAAWPHAIGLAGMARRFLAERGGGEWVGTPTPNRPLGPTGVLALSRALPEHGPHGPRKPARVQGPHPGRPWPPAYSLAVKGGAGAVPAGETETKRHNRCASGRARSPQGGVRRIAATGDGGTPPGRLPRLGVSAAGGG